MWAWESIRTIWTEFKKIITHQSWNQWELAYPPPKFYIAPEKWWLEDYLLLSYWVLATFLELCKKNSGGYRTSRHLFINLSSFLDTFPISRYLLAEIPNKIRLYICIYLPAFAVEDFGELNIPSSFCVVFFELNFHPAGFFSTKILPTSFSGCKFSGQHFETQPFESFPPFLPYPPSTKVGSNSDKLRGSPRLKMSVVILVVISGDRTHPGVIFLAFSFSEPLDLPSSPIWWQDTLVEKRKEYTPKKWTAKKNPKKWRGLVWFWRWVFPDFKGGEFQVPVGIHCILSMC